MVSETREEQTWFASQEETTWPLLGLQPVQELILIFKLVAPLGELVA